MTELSEERVRRASESIPGYSDEILLYPGTKVDAVIRIIKPGLCLPKIGEAREVIDEQGR